MAPPTVEVLIPNWNRAPLLRRALAALAEQTEPAAVCVIDNGSSDGSAEMVDRDFPEARCVALAENVGFGAAINRGARTSEADLLVMLNNDAVPHPRFVERLLAARRRSGAAMLAACLRLRDDTIDSCGVNADRALIAYDHLHATAYPPPADAAAPLGPCGGAAAYTREAFATVGGFDEQFFAYLEDLDLAIRLRLEGAECALAAEAFAVHDHAATLGAGSADKNRLLGRSRGYLLWKHGRNLKRVDRISAAVNDAITYTGQALLDRNLGAPRGRLEARAQVRGRRRPGPDPRFARIPLAGIGMTRALGLRWRRGRRYRGASGSEPLDGG